MAGVFDLNFRRLFIPFLLLLLIVMFPIVTGLEGKTDSALRPTASTPQDQVTNDDISTDVDSANETSTDEEHNEQVSDDVIFPKSLMVLDAGETEAVHVKQEPSNDAKTIGIVYGSLIDVKVIRHLDNGYSEISSYDYNSMKSINGYVPQELIKNVSVKGEYGVLVKLSEQKVFVYKDGVPVKTLICSTGLDEGGHSTPEGIYQIGSRGKSFFSPKYGQGAYDWVRFNKGYLFHSVPFDENEKIIAEEADKLGKKASHGCIRFSLDDARWFYKNIPQGAVVVIKN
jgi:hypothetical protein